MAMLLRTHFKLARTSIKENRTRSFLTCLGIAIGVASIILILSLTGSITNLVKSEISDIGADAQIVPERGVIVTNADYEPMMGMEDVFGPQSFHNGDYTFYYNNIKDNVAKRIAAYLGKTE